MPRAPRASSIRSPVQTRTPPPRPPPISWPRVLDHASPARHRHRSSNNVGPYQYPKRSFAFHHQCHRGQALPLYGDGKNVRDWLTCWTTARPSTSCSARARRRDLQYRRQPRGREHRADSTGAPPRGQPEYVDHAVVDRPGMIPLCARFRKAHGWAGSLPIPFPRPWRRR